MAQVCVLHDVARKKASHWKPAAAIGTLFGMSLCSSCIDRNARLIAEGASIREILAEAIDGEL